MEMISKTNLLHCQYNIRLGFRLKDFFLIKKKKHTHFFHLIKKVHQKQLAALTIVYYLYIQASFPVFYRWQ